MGFLFFLCLLSCRMSLRFRVNYLFIRYPLAWGIYILRYWIYREVQLDSTPEIEVYHIETLYRLLPFPGKVLLDHLVVDHLSLH